MRMNKLCPLRYAGGLDQLYCAKEKCQWWDEGREVCDMTIVQTSSTQQNTQLDETVITLQTLITDLNTLMGTLTTAVTTQTTTLNIALIEIYNTLQLINTEVLAIRNKVDTLS